MPGLTRRQLCAGSALATAAFGLGGCDPGASPGAPQRSLETFSDLVGSEFAMDTGPGRQALTLTAVRVHGPPIRVPRPRGESFTLIFQVDRSMAMTQGSRQVSHPRLGTFSMFLVPSPASGGTAFTATYCRL